ncbi:hypothetical protein PUN28_010974 [Cardiocondyla obscurior]|uniref:Uncharacterized protein n=1 Tax=Cardiocondyla obscurior TaxID=286306 RepID=A0AAW2FPI0_9HYME
MTSKYQISTKPYAEAFARIKQREDIVARSAPDQGNNLEPSVQSHTSFSTSDSHEYLCSEERKNESGIATRRCWKSYYLYARTRSSGFPHETCKFWSGTLIAKSFFFSKYRSVYIIIMISFS